MRLCADQPDAREGLRDGSLTLSAAAELQWAFDRQRRRGSISGTAAIAPAGSAAGSAAQNEPAADSVAPAVPLPPAEPQPPPLVLDAVGRQKLAQAAAASAARRRPARAPGRSARCWSTWPGAGAAGRPGAPARRRPVRAEGDHRRGVPAGAGAAPGAALARGPAHDHGAARRTPGQGGARPPRPEPAATPSAQRQSARGREGKRPANSDAGAGAREQRSGGEARRASGGHRGGAEDRPGRRPPRRFDAGVAAGCAATCRFGDEGRGDPRRRRSHTGAGGSADTDQVDGRRHSGGEVMRFGPRDSGGCQTTGAATRRRGLQLRRSTDRAPLQLNASDRDRPHRSWEPQTVWRPSPPPARAWQVTA